MKKIAFGVLVLAAAFASLASSQVSGDYNTSLGYMAGLDASGNRATFMGAGSGGEASNIRRTDYMGAAAGTFSRNVQDSVGMGYRAMRYASGMSNVVAIGSHQLEGRTNVTDTTSINGQFYASGQDGRMYIKTHPGMADANAPIYYANGNLYLNAAQIVTSGGGVISGGGEEAATTYDWYVSADAGSDSFDGKTVNTAFKTLDKALTSATTNEVVCVLAGTYGYPAFYANSDEAPYPVSMVASAGADKTFIVTNAANPGILSGASTEWTHFKGFTFKGAFNPPDSGHPLWKTHRGTYRYCYFEKCRFEDMDVTALGFQHPIWFVCVMDGCVVTNCLITSAENGSYYDGTFNDAIFEYVHAENCMIDIQTEAGSGTYPSFGSYSRFENSVLRIGQLNYAPYASLSVSRRPPTGATNGFYDVTMILDGFIGNATANNTGGKFWIDCLVGVGTNDVPPDALNDYMSGSVYTNKNAVAAALGVDNRARTPLRWYWIGYNSKADRFMKDAVVEEVLRILALQE